MTQITPKKITTTALLTALVFIATFVPHIPIPLGYAHLGDAVIFILVLMVNRRTSLIAACIGSALADFLGGFPLWIIPTLIIKAGMVEVVRYTLKVANKKHNKFWITVAFIFSSLWMAIAYTLFGALLSSSLAAGLASLPGLLLEGLLNTIIAVLLYPIVSRTIRM